jgi:micrococcal nuclease
MEPPRRPSRRPGHRRPSRLPVSALEIGLCVLVAACGGIGGGSPASASAYPSPVTDLAPAGATETARIVRVVDGDTIVIDRGRGDERVRYIGIDTPESVKPNTPVEFMAKEASAANEALVAGRDVVLERDVSDTDRYDRLLRYVWFLDGDAYVFVNLELVRRGFAQVATYPPDVRWTDTLVSAQQEAREAARGLWSPATPAP